MKFTELNDKQKATALDKHRDINVDCSEWCEHITSKFYEELNAIGFEGVESQYSGFCSQGDGASFTAESIDIEKFLRSQKRWSHYRQLHEMIRIKDITGEVKRDPGSRYSHYNTTEAFLDGDWQLDLTPKQQALYDELQKELDDYITEQGKAYYSELDTCYYDLISDENVKETIIANDMDFEETDHSVTYI